MEDTVKVWEEQVTIPTYGVGEPDKNPMFFEKRVYQGSSGAVYPNPVIEKIFDEKLDKNYQAIFLENKYLKIMILPELGGRVQIAYDKLKQRHFVYHNQVIKPALVGLTGPWISGGIEFNWPQHHRPSTFEPIDHAIEENNDGSKTVWVSEVERMSGTKGMAGFTLHPGKAYLEIKGRVNNRTTLPQTFLWWANPAVKVNDDYQSVFPPDVNAVFDHGRRDVSTFPVATGTYYKVDYSPGTDISRYKNIPVPTSYMAVNSNYNFVGGYEHDSRAGLLHIADHHISPGKKQWTWGHSDFGQAWDRNLTDEDGPYIELMTGVFTDNQPDFSWLMPNEEKSFTQYFLPYRELGLVKNATKDLLLNVEKDGERFGVKIFGTSAQKDLTIKVVVNGQLLLDEAFNISPELFFHRSIAVTANSDPETISTVITDKHNIELLRYEPAKHSRNQIPEPAKPALQPQDVENTEQLFLTGQHLEQYRHATYSPVPYYEEALRRDPKDSRNNNALGAWYLRRGQFDKAGPYFREAIEALTARNPNPYDGEPYYNLGLCLKYQEYADEAYDHFYKATWNSAWQDSGFFCLAQIDALRGDYETALKHIDQALKRNYNCAKYQTLKSAILRKLQRYEQAIFTCVETLDDDAFNLGALYEKSLGYTALAMSSKAQAALSDLLKISRGEENSLLTYALDYSAAGFYEEATALLSRQQNYASPMVHYHQAYFAGKLNQPYEITASLNKAAAASPYLCFPNKLEDIAALNFAINNSPVDAKAPYYLGNLWYDKRQYNEALICWELSVKIDDSFPTVHRNLGIAYFNRQHKREKALQSFEKAYALDRTDARVLMELDQLCKRLNREPLERLKLLGSNLTGVNDRDDLYLEHASLYNFSGDHQKAYDLIKARKFHPWEGGEGRVSGQYVLSMTELAKQRLIDKDYQAAIALLEQAQIYPHNLGEGKLYGAQENDIFYWLGCAHQRAGNDTNASQFFRKAAIGLTEPGAAMFYNDQQPDKIFYQGLAWQKLGDPAAAEIIFENLLTYGQQHFNDNVEIDYFAVSLPDLLIFDDDLDLRNRIHCLYLMGLGNAGLNKTETAVNLFEQVLELDAMHFGASVHKRFLTSSDPFLN